MHIRAHTQGIYTQTLFHISSYICLLSVCCLNLICILAGIHLISFTHLLTREEKLLVNFAPKTLSNRNLSRQLLSILLQKMKRWRFETLLLLAILSTCLVTVSTNDENDDDDDGVTIESEKVVRFPNFVGKIWFPYPKNKMNQPFFCVLFV